MEMQTRATGREHHPSKEAEKYRRKTNRKFALGAIAAGVTLAIGGVSDQPIHAEGLQKVEASSLEEALKVHTEGVENVNMKALEDLVADSKNASDDEQGRYVVPKRVEDADTLVPYERSSWDISEEVGGSE